MIVKDFLRKIYSRRFLPIVISFIFVCLTLVPVFIFSSTHNTIFSAQAGFIALCGDDDHLGHNMDSGEGRDSDDVARTVKRPDLGNRTYTLQDITGTRASSVVSYFGESQDTIIAGDTDEARVPTDKIPFLATPDFKDKAAELRTVMHCSLSTVGSFLANVFFGVTSLIMWVVSSIVTWAFDSSIICKDPANPSGACINLVKIIGGTSDTSTGLIGTLTSSIYFPMLTIAVLSTGIYIGWVGLVKRKFREALQSLLWMFFSIFLGLILLLNPHVFARAPMAASNAISACVIGAFNGENCFQTSNSVTKIEAGTSQNICNGSVAGIPLDEQTSITVNNLTCSLWKAFLVEPFSLSSFGLPYDDLDVYKGKVSKLFDTVEGLPPRETFCFYIGSTASPESGVTTVTTEGSTDPTTGHYQPINAPSPVTTHQKVGTTLVLDYDTGNSVICNLAAYQMFLQADAKSVGKYSSQAIHSKYGSSYDERWYNLIAVIAADEQMWSHWTGSAGDAFNALFGIIAAVVGTFIIVFTSIIAIVYYMASTILMAFAPLFLLFAVHPGRGKKMFLGWVEQVFSNVLKYIASAFFLIITITIYAAVLGTINNPFLMLFIVFIFTIGLFMYRKELIETLSRVNMGGERLGENLRKLQNKTKKITTSSIGSAAGAKFAGGSLRRGIKDGAVRELKQGGSGIVASSFRQYDRMGRQNTNIARKELSEGREELRSLEQQELNQNNDIASQKQIVDSRRQRVESTQNKAMRDALKLRESMKITLNTTDRIRSEAKDSIARGGLPLSTVESLRRREEMADLEGLRAQVNYAEHVLSLASAGVLDMNKKENNDMYTEAVRIRKDLIDHGIDREWVDNMSDQYKGREYDTARIYVEKQKEKEFYAKNTESVTETELIHMHSLEGAFKKESDLLNDSEKILQDQQNDLHTIQLSIRGQKAYNDTIAQAINSDDFEGMTARRLRKLMSEAQDAGSQASSRNNSTP